MLLGLLISLSEYHRIFGSASALILDSHELARQLQAEEGQFAQQEHEQYIQRQRERATYEQARRQAMKKDKEVKKKSPKDCVIV